jgi:hypothetical protein
MGRKGSRTGPRAEEDDTTRGWYDQPNQNPDADPDNQPGYVTRDRGAMIKLVKEFERLGIENRQRRLDVTGEFLGREITSSKQLSKHEFHLFMAWLKSQPDPEVSSER